jgi:hypothetical protein
MFVQNYNPPGGEFNAEMWKGLTQGKRFNAKAQRKACAVLCAFALNLCSSISRRGCRLSVRLQVQRRMGVRLLGALVRKQLE